VKQAQGVNRSFQQRGREEALLQALRDAFTAARLFPHQLMRLHINHSMCGSAAGVLPVSPPVQCSLQLMCWCVHDSNPVNNVIANTCNTSREGSSSSSSNSHRDSKPANRGFAIYQ
jgi:hypothetical protein